MSIKKISIALCLITAATHLSACTGVIDRLNKVGQTPEVTPSQNPQTQANYQPMTWPLPRAAERVPQTANSLWQPESRTFFRDLRASQVGDIIKVTVSISDRASLSNESETTRTSVEEAAAPQLYGLEGYLAGKLLPGAANLADLLTASGNRSVQGEGSIDRDETIQTEIAAVVTQKLPNGNLVISGSQEIRVNQEVRRINIAGVIRPQDIAADNSVTSSQVAEARISYGGEGAITDAQKPRYGYEIIDAIAPF